MTPEQMQAIAEREYPISDTGFFSGMQQKAFLHGLAYSKWIAVEDGLPEAHSVFPERSVRVDVTTSLGEVLNGYYLFTTGAWKVDGISLPVTAWQPLPEPYKK